DDSNYQMPPEGDRLTKAEIVKVKAWIDQGLVWPAELSLKKPTFKRPLSLRKIDLPKFDATHPIDRMLGDYFAENGVQYQVPLNDQQFLRRAKLDLLGQLPTAKELDEFSLRTEPNKRELMVDELLARDQDYADHWISFWNDLLRNDYAGTGFIDGGRKQITNWLYKSLLKNKPYDQFVNELISPTEQSGGFIKGIKWRGRVNASQIEPLQFSQNISQVFLGINMKCASCHDSFIDDWKLDDAYGLAAIISDTPLEMHRCDVGTGKNATSKFVFPTLGEIDQTKPKKERLAQLSALMTTKQNGRFSRTIVNRIWDRMTGRGLIHPVDVMASEAWSESLLDVLANDLVDNGYDLKRTMKLIVTSKVYQSASVRLEENPNPSDAFVFAGVIAKRMTAEQFVDAVWLVTEAAPKNINAKIDVFSAGKGKKPLRKFNVRASLLRSNPLMRSLGRPNREQVVTTRPAELSTLQALDLSNGKILAGWLNAGAKRWLARKSKQSWSNEQVVKNLFLESLSRQPSTAELKSLGSGEEMTQEAMEDLLWIVTMLPEFQFVK
ncbi:MAG: DUF1549 domain-containing protein, partial [Mariniblastus sp.]